MSEQKYIPELRFPEFQGEWGNTKLGKLFKISAGGDIPKDNARFEKDEVFQYPIYANAEANKGLYGYSDIYKISKDVVTVAGRGVNIGIAHARKERFYPIVRLLVLKPIGNQSVEFYEYAINNLDIFIESTGVPQLTAPQISIYKISYPQYPEQQKIASFFTAIDKKISQLKQKKTLLERYKIGVMQKIFSQEIRFSDDNGQEFPKWEKKRLGEIGKTFNGLTGKSKEDFGSGKPYIRYKQIFDDSKIDISKFDFVKIRDGEKQNRAQYGDVFFTTSSETPDEVGTASVLLDKVEDLYLNSFCFGYRSSFDKLVPQFSRYLFRNELFRNEIVKLSQGSTRYNMSKNELMKLEIDLPEIHEQTKIANFLSCIDEKINHTQTQIEKAEQWKKGLLQKMFV